VILPIADGNRTAALFVQFFFAWRIWTFTMPTYQKPIKMAVAVVCAFIVLVGFPFFSLCLIPKTTPL
jgi:hypothetical protein